MHFCTFCCPGLLHFSLWSDQLLPTQLVGGWSVLGWEVSQEIRVAVRNCLWWRWHFLQWVSAEQTPQLGARGGPCSFPGAAQSTAAFLSATEWIPGQHQMWDQSCSQTSQRSVITPPCPWPVAGVCCAWRRVEEQITGAVRAPQLLLWMSSVCPEELVQTREPCKPLLTPTENAVQGISACWK